MYIWEFTGGPAVRQRRQWHPTPVLLPGKSHGWRSLVGCSPWGHQESDTTERLHFHFSLSCTGEGNGNPLQCSCLENPRDGGAWWAALYGVAQSRTRLKRLSSSSSKSLILWKKRRTYFGGQWMVSFKPQIPSHLKEELVGYAFWELNRKWEPTPVFLPGKSQGQRSLVSYRPWSRQESDTT